MLTIHCYEHLCQVHHSCVNHVKHTSLSFFAACGRTVLVWLWVRRTSNSTKRSTVGGESAVALSSRDEQTTTFLQSLCKAARPVLSTCPRL